MIHISSINLRCICTVTFRVKPIHFLDLHNVSKALGGWVVSIRSAVSSGKRVDIIYYQEHQDYLIIRRINPIVLRNSHMITSVM